MRQEDSPRRELAQPIERVTPRGQIEVRRRTRRHERSAIDAHARDITGIDRGGRGVPIHMVMLCMAGRGQRTKPGVAIANPFAILEHFDSVGGDARANGVCLLHVTRRMRQGTAITHELE